MSLAPLLSVDLDTEPALRAARTLLLHSWLTRPQDLDLNRAAARVYTGLDNTAPVPAEHAEPFIQRCSLPIPGAVRTLGPRVLARICRIPEHKARWFIQNRKPDTLAFSSPGEACTACNALPVVVTPVQLVQDPSARGYTTSGAAPVTLDVAVAFEHLLFCFGDMRPEQITPGMTLALRTLAQAIGSPTRPTLHAYAEQFDTGAPADAIDLQAHVEIRRRLGLHLVRAVGGRQPQHVPRVVLRRFFEGLSEGMRQSEAARRANAEHATDWPAYMFNNRHNQLAKAMRFALPGELTQHARRNPEAFMAGVDRWLDGLDSRYFALTAAERQMASAEPGADGTVLDDRVTGVFMDAAGMDTMDPALARSAEHASRAPEPGPTPARDSGHAEATPLAPSPAAPHGENEPEDAEFEEVDEPEDEPEDGHADDPAEIMDADFEETR